MTNLYINGGYYILRLLLHLVEILDDLTYFGVSVQFFETLMVKEGARSVFISFPFDNSYTVLPPFLNYFKVYKTEWISTV